MQRASHEQPAPVRTTHSAPSAAASHGGYVQRGLDPLASDDCRSGAASSLARDSQSVRAAGLPATGVLRTPAGTLVRDRDNADNRRENRQRELALAIRQRIESRLAGRVRNLAVRIVGNTIILEGQCSTYYSKQLAQHAALGVIQDEQLENAIVVAVPR